MNTEWKKKAISDYTFFKDNFKNAKSIQEEYLLNLLKKNQDTKFGLSHHFKKIKSIKDFQKSVPIRDYESFCTWIDELKKGNQGVLTHENVLLFEPTGGTTSGTKLIPYTKALQTEFQKAINVWLMNITEHYPNVLQGLSYWAISPVSQNKTKTNGGIPIGFDNDYDYLGWSKQEAKKIFVVPDEIKQIKNIENFFYITALFLMKSKDMSFISVWNPTFLGLLLETIDNNKEKLVRDIHGGSISAPIVENIKFIEAYLSVDHLRAREIDKIWANNYSERYAKLWPKLKIISCWADASAKNYMHDLVTLFKDVYIQPKGLLATEGIITIPLAEAEGAVPAYTSHFLEFLPGNDQMNPKLIHELEENGEYSVLLTTGGGLYRYELKDKIKVTGIFNDLPIIEFIGRNETLDFVGEKLDETFVVKAIKQLELRGGLKFILFAPEISNNVLNYSLFIESKEMDTIKQHQVEKRLDKILCGSFHYKYARDINQISQVKVYFIQDGIKKYTARCVKDGQKLGDIKPVVIDRRLDWGDYFLQKR